MRLFDVYEHTTGEEMKPQANLRKALMNDDCDLLDLSKPMKGFTARNLETILVQVATLLEAAHNKRAVVAAELTKLERENMNSVHDVDKNQEVHV